MNVFRYVIGNVGLHDQSQGTNGVLYLLLEAMAKAEDDDPSPMVEVNAYQEVLARLRTISDGPGLKAVEQIIGTRV